MGFSFRRGKKHDEVIVDRVTGAFNRRQLDAVIASGFDLSDQPTAALVIEIDEFHRFEDKKGSNSRDQVLERVSWVVMATVRTSDVVYRHGSSGFCALLPATSHDDAYSVADRVRANVEKMPLLLDSGVTVSVGVAAGTSTDIASTIQNATTAIVTAAALGTNRVVAGEARDMSMTNSSSTPGELSAQASAELASAFAVQAGVADVDSDTPTLIEPDASKPLTPPSV